MWWIIDIAVLALLAVSIAKGYKRGFASALVSFVGTLAALVASIFLSGAVTDFVYGNIIRDRIMDSMEEKIDVSFEPVSIIENTSEVVIKATEELPEFVGVKIADAVSDNSGKLALSIREAVTDTGKTAAEAIEEQVVRPIITFLMKIVLFAVFQGILLVVVKALAKSLKVVNKIPFIGGANKLVGSVFGLLSGVISVLVFVYVLKLAALITENKIPVINDEDISQSITIGYIYNSELPSLLNLGTEAGKTL